VEPLSDGTGHLRVRQRAQGSPRRRGSDRLAVGDEVIVREIERPGAKKPVTGVR
jgi:hypothetical protein